MILMHIKVCSCLSNTWQHVETENKFAILLYGKHLQALDEFPSCFVPYWVESVEQVKDVTADRQVSVPTHVNCMENTFLDS